VVVQSSCAAFLASLTLIVRVAEITYVLSSCIPGVLATLKNVSRQMCGVE